MIFYHNLTKGVVNCTEEDQVIDYIAEGNNVMYTRSGDAILYPLTETQIKEFAEKWGRKIIEEVNKGEEFSTIATAYSMLGMIHFDKSVFKETAYPILESYLKSI